MRGGAAQARPTDQKLTCLLLNGAPGRPFLRGAIVFQSNSCAQPPFLSASSIDPCARVPHIIVEQPAFFSMKRPHAGHFLPGSVLGLRLTAQAQGSGVRVQGSWLIAHGSWLRGQGSGARARGLVRAADLHAQLDDRVEG